jgi:hypothetical protein
MHIFIGVFSTWDNMLGAFIAQNVGVQVTNKWAKHKCL